jgi:hypothetical protein
MSEQALALVEQLRRQIHAVRRRILTAEFAGGLLLTIAAGIGSLFVMLALEAAFWLPSALRLALVSLFVVLTGALFAWRCLPSALRLMGLSRTESDVEVAARVGKHFPAVADRLVNVFNLAEGKRSNAPAPLVEGAVFMLARQVEGIRFAEVEQFRMARQVGRFSSFPVALILVTVLSAPGPFMGAGARLLSPNTLFERPAPFSLILEPGNTELVRGQHLAISGRAVGSYSPASVSLELQILDEERIERITLDPSAGGTFDHEIANIRKPLRYRALAERVTSEWYTVQVTDRPIMRGLDVALHPPAYTRLPTRHLDSNVGDVTALAGTRVEVTVDINDADVTGAALVFDGDHAEPLQIEGSTASGAFVLNRNTTYTVRLHNSDGLENAGAVEYRLTAVPDEAPTVRIVEPGPSRDLDESLAADVIIGISDDFGFSRLRVYYRLAESRFGTPDEQFRPIDIALEEPRLLDQDVFFDWNLRKDSGLDLVPGDVVEYFAAVRDNDAVSGFKESRSGTHRLRVPSLAERYERIERSQNTAETAMQEVLRDTEALRRQFDELRDAVRRRQQGEWEDQRQAESLQSAQREMEQRVEELSRAVEEITQELSRNNLLSEETVQKYQELQRVIQEINDPELQRALRELQEAMQNLDLQKMQESIRDFEFSESEYRERIERAVELFKRIRAEQSFEEALRRTEEIMRQLEELRQNTEQAREGDSDAAADLAESQQEATQDAEALAEQLERLQEQLQDLKGSAPRDELQALIEQLKQETLGEMNQSLDALEQGQMSEASESQQRAQDQMQQAAGQLQEMMEGMQSGQMQINMAALRMALENVLRLSFSQERLRTSTAGLGGDSGQLRVRATEQGALRDVLAVVSDSLQSVARQVPQMRREVQRKAGEAMREMNAAIEQLRERSGPQASNHQQAAMARLNELALMLADLLDQLQSGGGEGGGGMSAQQMMQQMQQMMGQQQGLNDQIQQMLNDIQGDRLASDGQQRLQQMAEQQEAIRRQLEELSRDPSASGFTRNHLERAIEQMEETIRELRRNQITRPMTDRQEQIIHRMLEAERSMQQRGEDDRRESRRGAPIHRDSPGDTQPEDRRLERLRRDLLRALESGYSHEYEELIKRYFELLRGETEER